MCVSFVKRIINFDSTRDRDEKEILSQTQFKVNLQKMTEIGGNMVKGWYDRNWWEYGINNIF